MSISLNSQTNNQNTHIMKKNKMSKEVLHYERLKALTNYVKGGFNKEQLYDLLPKRFVNANFENALNAIYK